MSAAPACLARRTRPRRARREAQPLERDAGLQLDRLEHAITLRLADSACRESCAELSAYLDACHEHERMDAQLYAQAIGVRS